MKLAGTATRFRGLILGAAALGALLATSAVTTASAEALRDKPGDESAGARGRLSERHQRDQPREDEDAQIRQNPQRRRMAGQALSIARGDAHHGKAADHR